MLYTVNIEVKETAEKKWGLCVNGIVIGDSKNRFDADHSVIMLKKALGVCDEQENITEFCNI